MVNGTTYRAIVRESLLPNWRRYEEQEVYFQQDNGSPHTAELTTAVFEEYDINLIEWPANSQALGERGEPETLQELKNG